MTGKRSVSAGGNMHGVAAATGDHATATASYATQPVPDGVIDLATELRAVREQLAKIPDMDPKALTRLDEAQTEASAPEPDRDEVSNLVGQATRYAKKAAGFAEHVGETLPALARVAVGVGKVWDDWRQSLGL